MSTYLIKYTKKVGKKSLDIQINLPTDDYVVPYVMRHLKAVKIYSVIDVADIQDRNDPGAKWDTEKLNQYIGLHEAKNEKIQQDILAKEAAEAIIAEAEAEAKEKAEAEAEK